MTRISPASTHVPHSEPVSSPHAHVLPELDIHDVERIIALLQDAKQELGAVIFGQDQVIALTLTTLLSGGHGLLIGLPGLAKTKLVDTLGRVLGLDTRRVQFTPDLMPGDILGSEILDEDAEKKRFFRFLKGPVFTSLLMADEINRASPRTQSALLQAMQEGYITINGVRYDLPQPFHVLATQNPIEQEGTYPLPEAQLDRFIMQIDVGYPDRDAEKRMLLQTTGSMESDTSQVMTSNDLITAQHLVRRMPIGEQVVEAILDLVQAARPSLDASANSAGTMLAWGAGPRAGQALMLATRARALLEGRFAPSLDDVKALAVPILKHRLALTYTARAEGVTVEHVILNLTQGLR
jgi:MoxR-like ATPase